MFSRPISIQAGYDDPDTLQVSIMGAYPPPAETRAAKRTGNIDFGEAACGSVCVDLVTSGFKVPPPSRIGAFMGDV